MLVFIAEFIALCVRGGNYNYHDYDYSISGFRKFVFSIVFIAVTGNNFIAFSKIF